LRVFTFLSTRISPNACREQITIITYKRIHHSFPTNHVTAIYSTLHSHSYLSSKIVNDVSWPFNLYSFHGTHKTNISIGNAVLHGLQMLCPEMTAWTTDHAPLIHLEQTTKGLLTYFVESVLCKFYIIDVYENSADSPRLQVYASSRRNYSGCLWHHGVYVPRYLRSHLSSSRRTNRDAGLVSLLIHELPGYNAIWNITGLRNVASSCCSRSRQ